MAAFVWVWSEGKSLDFVFKDIDTTVYQKRTVMMTFWKFLFNKWIRQAVFSTPYNSLKFSAKPWLASAEFISYIQERHGDTEQTLGEVDFGQPRDTAW